MAGRLRGKNKKPTQAEKILLVLLDGRQVSAAEVEATLEGEIQLYRLSSYLWQLEQRGADIARIKEGRNITFYQLMNTDVMMNYARSRGLIGLPPVQETVVLSASDFAISG
jgi:hypothetical protein